MSFINKRAQFIVRRKNGRGPSSYPTDYGGSPMRITRMFPMKLKDISLDDLKERTKKTEVMCTQELMSLFDCFERNDFSSQACQIQAAALEQCYTSASIKKFG